MTEHQLIDRRPHGAGVLNSSDAWTAHDRLAAATGAAGEAKMNGNSLSIAGERAVARESEAWRRDVRDLTLLQMISSIEGDLLVRAFKAWWQAYTQAVRDAPSNRTGISPADAAKAANRATWAVQELLAGDVRG